MLLELRQDGAVKGNGGRWLAAMAGTAVAASAILLRQYAPASLHLPPCPFHALTGLYCPGCGSTRAIHHLLNFEFEAALRCNFLAVAMLPYLTALFGVKALRRFKVWRGPELELPVNGVWCLTALVIAWWVVRNLPLACFAIPAQ